MARSAATRRTDPLRALGVVASVLLIAACSGGGSSDTPEPSVEQQSITVRSASFEDGAAIPVEFSCDGSNTSPALQWSGVPDSAKALALVVADPDAPGGTFYHWVVADIPTTTLGVDAGGTPKGGVVAENSSGDAAYMGPCPPSGTHRYRFTVYALSTPSGVSGGESTEDAVTAIDKVAAAGGTLTGTFSRS